MYRQNKNELVDLLLKVRMWDVTGSEFQVPKSASKVYSCNSVQQPGSGPNFLRTGGEVQSIVFDVFCCFVCGVVCNSGPCVRFVECQIEQCGATHRPPEEQRQRRQASNAKQFWLVPHSILFWCLDLCKTPRDFRFD